MTGRGRREPATEIFRTQYKDHDLLKAEPYAGIKDLIRALRAQGLQDRGCYPETRKDYALTLLEHYHFTELCDSPSAAAILPAK